MVLLLEMLSSKYCFLIVHVCHFQSQMCASAASTDDGSPIATSSVYSNDVSSEVKRGS